MSRRRQPGGRPSGFLLALAMVLAMAACLLPGVSTPAWADGEHTHTIGEGESVQTITFQPWDKTDSLPTEAGSYYLTVDVKLATSWNVPTGGVNLCLNGKNVTYTGDAGSVITLAESGGGKPILNLFDEDGDKGSISGGKGIVPMSGDQSGRGGGVCLMAGTLNMYGGTITDNHTVGDNGGGGGVCVDSIATFNMYGGSIKDNTSAYGGGVRVEGTFNMYRGSIEGNGAKAIETTDGEGSPVYRGGQGGGVCVNAGINAGTFTMNGGSITGNYAHRYGGGVYNYGTFNISGAPKIDGNTHTHIPGDPDADNVYLVRYAVVNVADELTNAKPIGITMQAEGVFTSGGASGYASKFVSDDANDDDGHTVAVRGDELMLQHRKHSMEYDESGATVTAECVWPSSCSLPDGKVTLTIKAPTLTVYGGEGSAEATLEGLEEFNKACGLSLAATDIKYYKATADGDAYTKGDPLPAAPTDAGDYLAEISVRTDKGDDDSVPSYVTASVGYTIHKADPAVDKPGPLSGTQGDLLESVKLPEVEGGTWSWEADPGARLENVGECDFSATFTPDDTANYTTIGGVSVTVNVAAAPESGRAEMFRLYNPYSGEHFYTASEVERDSVAAAGWSFEGVGWVAPTEGAPVFRLYNPYAGDHHYTTSATERDYLVSVGWSDEGVGWRSAGSDGVPLWRQYNPNATAGAHNYTASESERDMLVSVGWRHEGIGWYGLR